MIEILSKSTHLKISPYERIEEPDIRPYEHIKVWVEFTMSNLKTEFSAEYLAGDLKNSFNNLKQLHQSITKQVSFQEVTVSDIYNQIQLTFTPSQNMDNVGLYLSLRPEEDDEAITLNGGIAIDQSYLPSIIYGLEEILNFSN